MQLLYGKEYWRQCEPERSTLEQAEIERCIEAVDRFQADPRIPGLNFERLGSGSRQNHWSIRASRELRVVLAVEWERGIQESGGRPKRFAPVNMGHHDAMYRWAGRRQFHTDLSDSALVWPGSKVRGSGRPHRAEQCRPPIGLDEWMLFPSKEQEILIRRYFSGAARVRGAAGTGKTVVALNRAAVLGNRYPDERVLVTTFSRSLCNHMQVLFERLPDCPDNVDFINVDALPSQLLGPPRRIDFDQEAIVFDQAYRNTVPGNIAEKLPPDYLREEIRRVIKGRDASREEYLDTGKFERLGRIRSFKKRDREICWRLCQAWDRGLKERGLASFPDRLIEARNRAWEETTPPYRAVIVDEGQDMTLVGMQLVRALVAGHPENELKLDSILVMDDSAQRIYPGGFRPQWANLDFRGSSRTLRLNYRNDRRIFEAAQAVRGEAVLARDANDDGAAGAVEFDCDIGRTPILLQTPPNREALAIRGEIRKLVDRDGFEYEQIALLTRRNKNVDSLLLYLRNRQIPCVNLKALRSGQLESGVRVGTFDRAQGNGIPGRFRRTPRRIDFPAGTRRAAGRRSTGAGYRARISCANDGRGKGTAPTTRGPSLCRDDPRPRAPVPVRRRRILRRDQEREALLQGIASKLKPALTVPGFKCDATELSNRFRVNFAGLHLGSQQVQVPLGGRSDALPLRRQKLVAGLDSAQRYMVARQVGALRHLLTECFVHMPVEASVADEPLDGFRLQQVILDFVNNLPAAATRDLTNEIVHLLLQENVLMRDRFVKQDQRSGSGVQEGEQEQELECAAACVGEVERPSGIRNVFANIVNDDRAQDAERL